MKCIRLEQFNFSTEKFFESNVNFKLADVRTDLFLQCSEFCFSVSFNLFWPGLSYQMKDKQKIFVYCQD